MNTLMIIDDESTVIDGIRVLISILNLDDDINLVGYAYDGISAFNMACSLQPDIVVTDIRIPKIDGLSLIEALKAFLPETVFIVISGYQDFQYAQKAIDLGAVYYIDKPITKDKFGNAIQRAIEKLDGIHKSKEEYIEPQVIEHFLSLCHTDVVNHDTLLKILQPLKKQNDLNMYKSQIYKLLCILTIMAFSEDALLRANMKALPSYRQIMMYKSISSVDEYFIEYVSKIIQSIRQEPVKNTKYLVQKVQKYILDNYNQNLSLESLAKIVHISPTYLSVVFKKNVGESYIQYLTSVRIEKAKQLIRTGHLITDVSGEIGYINYRHFYSVFKKYTGFTPTEYRELAQNDDSIKMV